MASFARTHPQVPPSVTTLVKLGNCKFCHTLDEILRDAEIKAFALAYLEGVIAFALSLKLLSIGELEFAVLPAIVGDHFFENVIY